MRSFFTITLFLFAGFLSAQTRLVPGKNIVEKKWMRNQDFEMTWYAIRDTARFAVGKIYTQISSNRKEVIVITRVNVNKANTSWIDSSVARASDLSPVYHSSYNTQRDMVLKFGKIVSGYCKDKIQNSLTQISDTTVGAYFDSNLYPTLITWLPLQEGYRQDISIYDYTPGKRKGVIQATVQHVHKGIFYSARSGSRPVWVVTVTDEIGGDRNSIYTYYIDVEDRRLWKQQMDLQGNKMEMELIER